MSEQVITVTSQLTKRWLDEVLRESGDLLRGAVKAFKVEPLKSENSNIARIRLAYDDASSGNLPASLFLKMCGGGNSHDFGPSEVAYYRRDYMGRANLPMLKCYSAVCSVAKKSYHLLLEEDRKKMRWLWEAEFRRVLVATQDLNCLALLA